MATTIEKISKGGNKASAKFERECMKILLASFDTQRETLRWQVVHLITCHIIQSHEDFVDDGAGNVELFTAINAELEHLSDATLSALAHDLKGL